MIVIHWTWLATLPLIVFFVWAAIVPREKVINVLARLKIIKQYVDVKGLPQYCAQLWNPISWVAIVVIAVLSGVMMVFDTGYALVNDALSAGKRQKKPASPGQKPPN